MSDGLLDEYNILDKEVMMMDFDLDRLAIFASWLTILGDTIAVLYEMNQPPEDNDKEDEDNKGSDSDKRKNSNCDEEDEDEDEDNGEDCDYGILGEFLSFLGDLINAIVAQVQARQKYGECIPKYVQKGIIGGWLEVFGDILQLQSALEESAKD